MLRSGTKAVKDFLKSNDGLIRFYHEARLSRVGGLSASPEHLRSLEHEELSGIFADWDLEQAFRQAEAAYARVSERGALYGTNMGDTRALFHLVAALKPRNVLEIGTCNGVSTAFIAHALRAFQTEAASLTTVDLVDVNDPAKGFWKMAGLPLAPVDVLRHLGLADHVRFVSGGSGPFLSATDERFDFVFIDGSHDSATVYGDIMGILECLAPGAVVLMHDYYPQGKRIWPEARTLPGVYMAVKRAMADCPSLDVLPLGELPWGTKFGGSKTSLAVLTRK